MKLLLRSGVVVLSVSYPFWVYWGSQTTHQPWLVLLLFTLLGCRLGLTGSRGERLALIMLMACMAVFALLQSTDSLLKVYPALISLVLLMVFVRSLYAGMPVIERLARLSDPNLPDHAVLYTRRVTQVWCMFFLVNSCLALITVYISEPLVWLWYNGIIAYLLILLILVGEWLIRQKFKAKYD